MNYSMQVSGTSFLSECHTYPYKTVLCQKTTKGQFQIFAHPESTVAMLEYWCI